MHASNAEESRNVTMQSASFSCPTKPKRQERKKKHAHFLLALSGSYPRHAVSAAPHDQSRGHCRRRVWFSLRCRMSAGSDAGGPDAGSQRSGDDADLDSSPLSRIADVEAYWWGRGCCVKSACVRQSRTAIIVFGFCRGRVVPGNSTSASVKSCGARLV